MKIRLPGDPLFDELVVLARAMRAHDIPLFIAGGYGLVLRTEYIRTARLRTLREVPSVRSTEDLDLFMTADLIVDARRVEGFLSVLLSHGYSSVRGREHYQFMREVDIYGQKRAIKVDLLTALPNDGRKRADLKWKGDRRVRPASVIGIHAHPSPEAITLSEHPLELSIDDEAESPVSIFLPHPFTYLLLKLFAMRDQMLSPNGNPERHAVDLYRIAAMITEPEWNQVLELSRKHRAHVIVEEARNIVRTHFKDKSTPAVRVVRSFLRQEDLDDESAVEELIGDLRTLFSVD